MSVQPAVRGYGALRSKLPSNPPSHAQPHSRTVVESVYHVVVPEYGVKISKAQRKMKRLIGNITNFELDMTLELI
jgi:hypothetical protein